MRIPLLNTSFVQTPESTVRVPQLRYEGGEALAKGIETFGLNVVDLLNKKKDADNLRVQLDFDMELDNKALEFEKWKRDPKNANVDDPISTWENHLNDNILNGTQDFINNAKTDARTKYQMESKLNNWKNQMKVSTYADGVARSGEQLKGSLDLMKQKAISSENPSQMDAYSQYLNRSLQSGIIKQEQYDLLLEDASNTKQSIGNKKFSNNVQALVDAGNFDGARKTIMDAESNGFISPSEANAQKTRLTYKIEYNNKLEDAQVEADNDPSEFLKKLQNTTSTGVKQSSEVITGAGTVFGLNLDGSIDMEDNGRGAFGYNTRDPKLVGVSLPFATLEKMFGPNYDQYVKKNKPLIEVTNSTGQTITAPIVDKGPAKWTGNAIDLTYAAAKQLGSTGKDNYTFKLAGQDTGPFANLSANDRYKLAEQAKSNLARKASEQFRTFKQGVDIGQIALTMEQQVKFDETGEYDILQSPQFKELNNSPLGQIAKNYIFKQPSSFNDVYSEIIDYNPIIDTSKLQYATLQTKIDTMFEGAYKDQLSKKLKDTTDLETVRSQNKILSAAMKSLNDIASRNIKIQKTQDIPAKEGSWFFGMGGQEAIPNAPVVTTPTIEVEVGVGVDKKIKKIKDVSTPVMVEDPNKKLEVDLKVQQIREELESEIINGKITNSENAMSRMKTLATGKELSFSTNPSKSTSTSNIPTVDPTKFATAISSAKTRQELDTIEAQIKTSGIINSNKTTYTTLMKSLDTKKNKLQ